MTNESQSNPEDTADLRILLRSIKNRPPTAAEVERIEELAERTGWRPSPELKGVVRAFNERIAERDRKIAALEARVAELQAAVANIRRGYVSNDRIQ